jgi:Flp pilus assembly protein TadD
VVLVGVALIVVVLGAPYLSQEYVNTALRTYKARPSVAYADLSRAARLDPWSAGPWLEEGQIAERLGDPSRARSAFEHVLRIEDNWYAWTELTLLDAQAGRFKRAASDLGRAAKLDVDDAVLTQARTMIRRHRRIDPVRFNALFTQGVNAFLFQSENIK